VCKNARKNKSAGRAQIITTTTTFRFFPLLVRILPERTRFYFFLLFNRKDNLYTRFCTINDNRRYYNTNHVIRGSLVRRHVLDYISYAWKSVNIILYYRFSEVVSRDSGFSLICEGARQVISSNVSPCLPVVWIKGLWYSVYVSCENAYDAVLQVRLQFLFVSRRAELGW